MVEPALSVTVRQAGPIPLDIAFDLGSRELLAVVGPSGAGKTTLLRALAGLYRPAHGRIRCGDEVWLDTAAGVDRPPYVRRAGLMFQSYALFPHLTAGQNIACALGHLPRRKRAAAADALLARVQLAGFGDRKPAALSGGQQQRVALARALAREPAVLLLDEPLSAVDRRTRRQVHADLLALRDALAVPIILVTHDLEEACSLADRLAVIDRGELLQIGPTGEVMAAPRSRCVAEILDMEHVGSASPSTDAPRSKPLTLGAGGVIGLAADGSPRPDS